MGFTIAVQSRIRVTSAEVGTERLSTSGNQQVKEKMSWFDLYDEEQVLLYWLKQGEIVLFGTLGQDLFVEESDDGIGDGLGDGGGLLGLLFGVGGDRFGVVLGGPLVESLFAEAAGNDLR